jgi:tRNA dimethylallyltransferase
LILNKSNLKNKIILIAGPTASGKSKLAITISKKINGEIINADSMQVYKNFSILTSRPSKQDEILVKHHLYGFLSVKKNFSVGEWLKLLKIKIKICFKNKKTPVIVGGTGLYFNAITNGISKIPTIDDKFRKKIRLLHNQIGQEEFYQKLIAIDPLVKKKISLNDTQRTIRAYEVKSFTKKSLYQWTSNTKSNFLNYDIKKIFVDTPRDILLKKIDIRTKLMFENNCINEVKSFMKLNIDSSLSPSKIIGIKEIKRYLTGDSSLSETINGINIKTRQYAKSQKTWCRGHMDSWNKLYFKDFSTLVKKALKEIS